MKTKFYLFLFLIFVLSKLHAQSFVIGLTGGYCLPIASSFNSSNTNEIQNQGFPQYYTAQQSITRTSYGQGGNIALKVDWFSKYNIGCGINLNAMISSHYSYVNNVAYVNGESAIFNFTDKPFSFQFIPHVNFKHDFKLVSAIVEMGMILGATDVVQSYTADYSTGDRVQSDINHYGGVLLGFYSSLGVAFRVSKVVRVSLAVTCSAASYSPTDWERTSFVVNGTDRLSSLDVSSKQGIYVKQLDLTATQPIGEPHQDLKFTFPFSNVGINAGIAFEIHKRDPNKAKTMSTTKPRKHPVGDPEF